MTCDEWWLQDDKATSDPPPPYPLSSPLHPLPSLFLLSPHISAIFMLVSISLSLSFLPLSFIFPMLFLLHLSILFVFLFLFPLPPSFISQFPHLALTCLFIPFRTVFIDFLFFFFLFFLHCSSSGSAATPSPFLFFSFFPLHPIPSPLLFLFTPLPLHSFPSSPSDLFVPLPISPSLSSLLSSNTSPLPLFPSTHFHLYSSIIPFVYLFYHIVSSMDLELQYFDTQQSSLVACLLWYSASSCYW